MSNSNFDKKFNSTFNFVKVFIGIVFVLIIGSFVFRGYYMASNNGTMYEITVPMYNGTSQSHLTKKYKEHNGCITFVDEFGFKQTICGNYNITQWK